MTSGGMDALQTALQAICVEIFKESQSEFKKHLDKLSDEVLSMQQQSSQCLTRLEHVAAMHDLKTQMDECTMNMGDALAQKLAHQQDAQTELRQSLDDALKQQTSQSVAREEYEAAVAELKKQMREDTANMDEVFSKRLAQHQDSHIELTKNFDEAMKQHSSRFVSRDEHGVAIDVMKKQMDECTIALGATLTEKMAQLSHTQTEIEQSFDQALKQQSSQLVAREEFGVVTDDLKKQMDECTMNMGDALAQKMAQQHHDVTQHVTIVESSLQKAISEHVAKCLDSNSRLTTSCELSEDRVHGEIKSFRAELQQQVANSVDDVFQRQSCIENAILKTISQQRTEASAYVDSQVAKFVCTVSDKHRALEDRLKADMQATASTEQLDAASAEMQDMTNQMHASVAEVRQELTTCSAQVGEMNELVDSLKDAMERKEAKEHDFDMESVTIEIQLVRKEVGEMREQWLSLGGHMNPGQKIQHVKDVKIENNQLREELMHTRKMYDRHLREHQGSMTIRPNVTRGGC